MTPEQVYDAMIEFGWTEPAVLRWGDLCVAGYWVSTSEYSGTEGLILKSDKRAIQTLIQGKSWEAVATGLKTLAGRMGPGEIMATFNGFLHG